MGRLDQHVVNTAAKQWTLTCLEACVKAKRLSTVCPDCA